MLKDVGLLDANLTESAVSDLVQRWRTYLATKGFGPDDVFVYAEAHAAADPSPSSRARRLDRRRRAEDARWAADTFFGSPGFTSARLRLDCPSSHVCTTFLTPSYRMALRVAEAVRPTAGAHMSARTQGPDPHRPQRSVACSSALGAQPLSALPRAEPLRSCRCTSSTGACPA